MLVRNGEGVLGAEWGLGQHRVLLQVRASALQLHHACQLPARLGGQLFVMAAHTFLWYRVNPLPHIHTHMHTLVWVSWGGRVHGQTVTGRTASVELVSLVDFCFLPFTVLEAWLQ